MKISLSAVILFAVLFLFSGDASAADSIGVSGNEQIHISTVSLDRATYRLGEEAAVSVVWLPGGAPIASRTDMQHQDASESGVLTAYLEIRDQNSRLCSDPVFATLFSEDTRVSLRSRLTSDCLIPYARVVLLDADRKVLDSKLSIDESDLISPPVIVTVVLTPLTIGAAIAIAFFIVSSVIIVVSRRKMKK